jgi:hypothetical protein
LIIARDKCPVGFTGHFLYAGSESRIPTSGLICEPSISLY